MTDYISRDDVRRFFQVGENCNKCQRDAHKCQYYEEMSIMDVCSMIDDIPAADVVEVKHGQNIGEDYAECDQFVCDQCGVELQDWHRVERYSDGEVTYHEYVFRYCPNCGAKMDGGADDGEI